jgi:hypothetical protein
MVDTYLSIPSTYLKIATLQLVLVLLESDLD